MSEATIFYKNLQELIKTSSKSFNRVERELGYPRNALHNYKKGRWPSAERLVEIARYFGVSPDYMMSEQHIASSFSTEEVFNHLDSEQKKEMYLLCQKWLYSLIFDRINNP